MKKSIITTLTAAALLSAPCAHATTVSKSYRVSVTIPEHTVIPQQQPQAQLNFQDKAHAPQFQLVQEMRAGQEITLQTFVAK